jgi:hypothetical protein
MLAAAARSVTDDRVSWVRASAEEFDQVVPGPAEAVVCNSAIWQTDFVSTVRAARAVLADGGVFAFNFGAEFLRAEDGTARANTEFPLMAMMRQIAAEEYDWSPPAGATSRRPRLSQREVSEILASAGFAVRQAWLEYEQSPESQQAWLTVPSFTDRQLPGLPYEARMAVLDKAFQRLGPPGVEVERWLAVAATAC